MLIIRDDARRNPLPLYQVEEITLEQALSFIAADGLPEKASRSDTQTREALSLPQTALTV